MATYKVFNAPALETMSMTAFRSRLGGGLAKGNRYFVQITPCTLMRQFAGGLDITEFSNELSYFCEGAELPGRLFNVYTYRYHGPNRQQPYQSEFQNISLNFIVRDRMLEKQYFDNWFELMNPQGDFDMRYKDDYKTEIKIFKMLEYDNGVSSASYEMTMVDAWPAAMEPMPLAWGDDTYLKLQVTFNYTHYRRDTGQGGNSYDKQPAQFEIVPSQYNTEGGTTVPNLLDGGWTDYTF